MTPPPIPEPTLEPGGLADQLEALYAERELLDRELGFSDAENLVAAFRSLEAQLVSLYAEHARA